MTKLGLIRETIGKALDEIQGAEIVYKDVLANADNEVKNSRQQIVYQDDNIEDALLRLRSRSHSALLGSQHILTNLRLKRRPPSQYNLPPNLSVEDSMVHAQDLVELIESTLRELSTLEHQLLERRKKWWKFW